MRFSEITIEDIKLYCRIDYDDKLLDPILAASKEFVKSYTGLEESALDSHSDIPLAVLAVCSSLYDSRSYTVDKGNINPTISSILDRYRENFIAEV